MRGQVAVEVQIVHHVHQRCEEVLQHARARVNNELLMAVCRSRSVSLRARQKAPSKAV